MTTTAPAAEAPTPRPGRRRFPMWRRILSALLIVFSCALIPVSVLALWVRNEILNTDDYVRTVSPLAENQDIIDALSVRVTNTLFENVDVEELAKENLPPKISFLAGPLAGGLKSFTQDATLRFFQSEQFRKLWDEANRRAHTQVVKALTGGGKVISTRNGRVTIDLSAIAVNVRSELSARGIGVFDKLPIGTLALRYDLFDSEALGHAQSAVRLLNTLRWVLPVLVLGLGAAGILLAGNRRRGLLRWGLGVVVATLFLGFALALGRGLYLGALPADASQSANAAAYDIVVRLLRTTNRVLFVVGLLIALGAYLAGTSRIALAVRGRTTGALDGVGDRVATGGFDFHGVAKFVGRYANPLRIAGVIASFLILVIMNHPGVAAVLWLLIALLVYLAVVTILERVGRDRTVATNATQ